MQQTDVNVSNDADESKNNTEPADTEAILYRASETPKGVSMVQGWTHFHHGIESYKASKTSKKWKHLAVVVLIFIFIVLILWGGVTYKQLRDEIDINRKLAQDFNYKLTKLQKEVKEKKSWIR